MKKIVFVLFLPLFAFGMEDNQLLEAVKSGENDFRNIKRDYALVIPLIIKMFMADGDNKQTPSILLAHLASNKSALTRVVGSYQPLISYIAEISKDHSARCDEIFRQYQNKEPWRHVKAYLLEEAYPDICRLKIKTVLLKHLENVSKP